MQDTKFCKEVDMPINQVAHEYLPVRALSCVLIKFDQGLLRLFFKCPQSGCSPSQLQMQMIKHITTVMPQFLQRIYDVRSQINTLALSNMEQANKLEKSATYNHINTWLNQFQHMILQDSDL